MSFLRLLAAGKSLMGIKDRSGRYRVAPGNALPKFAAASNPFRGTVKPSAERAPETVQDNSGPETQVPKPAEAETVTTPEPEETKSESLAPVCLADKRVEAGRFKRMMASLWPESRGRSKGGTVTVRRPIQGELQLDQVKVVRNDLSETDWEVVRKAPGKPARKGNSGTASATPEPQVEEKRA